MWAIIEAAAIVHNSHECSWIDGMQSNYIPMSAGPLILKTRSKSQNHGKGSAFCGINPWEFGGHFTDGVDTLATSCLENQVKATRNLI